MNIDMDTVLAVCTVLNTIFLGTITVLIVVVLLIARRVLLLTEETVRNVNDKVQALKGFACFIKSFTEGSRSFWARIVEFLCGTIAAFRRSPAHPRTEEQDSDRKTACGDTH